MVQHWPRWPDEQCTSATTTGPCACTFASFYIISQAWSIYCPNDQHYPRSSAWLGPRYLHFSAVVRLIKAFASPDEEDLRTSMIHHTDFGTITLLANVLGGLQILAPGKAAAEEQAWLYVRPKPGCLIVNLGDAMVQWSGGLLRSNCHRIKFAPGEQRFVDRYSLAILVRPERDASMRRLVGEGEYGVNGNLTAWEWEVKKAMALKRGDAVMESKGGKHTAII
jgi:isopenicillin N synthase-like dioxygenase